MWKRPRRCCAAALVHYALLPNYRAYWKEAGYVDEMTAIENAIADNRPDDIPKYLTDRWLADNTLFGPAGKGARGRRGMARRRRQHAGPRAELGRRQPDHGAQGAVRRIQLIATRMRMLLSYCSRLMICPASPLFRHF